MSRKKAHSKGWGLSEFLWIAGIFAYFTTNGWIAGGLIALAVSWRFLLGPPSLDKLIRKGLTEFHYLGPEDWKALEQKALRYHAQKSGRQLLYAMRVASVVPAVTQLPTLASRYDVVMGGVNITSGLMAAGNHHLKEKVKSFIDVLFLNRLEIILQNTVKAYQQKVKAAKTSATKEKYKAAALQKLLDWEGLFFYTLPGLDTSFERHRSLIEDGAI